LKASKVPQNSLVVSIFLPDFLTSLVAKMDYLLANQDLFTGPAQMNDYKIVHLKASRCLKSLKIRHTRETLQIHENFPHKKFNFKVLD
jgi:hypothetical protein